ncbi:MAG TPA: hypothetical protein VNB24_09615 [Acidimicrobiales bacterium]|nr:hypothetical protein [Acidimicrobiales bacterium]
MATVRASCPSCGDVEMAGTAISAMLCISTAEGSYAFQCPSCSDPVVKQADQRVLELLVASGISLTEWDLPEEATEVHHGDAFTLDDVLAFHELLQDDSWFATVESLVRDSSDPGTGQAAA